MIWIQTLMLFLESDPANLGFMVFWRYMINKLINSLTRWQPLYKSWYTVPVQNILFQTSSVLIIIIHQFNVAANGRKKVDSDELKLATGGVSIHLNTERKQCN